MSFHDLPKGWPSRSLEDPVLAADVVDLVVRDSERAVGSLSLLLCDDTGRMIQPVTIEDVPHGCTEEERERVFDAFVGHLGGALGGLVLALGRPRGRVPEDPERAWHETAIRACDAGGVRLLGCYLATEDGVVAMPRWTEPRLAG